MVRLSRKQPGYYILAWYELDRAYGGPEEGGWWFTCGQFTRVWKVVRDKEEASRLLFRANEKMQYMQRNNRSIGSMAYSGGNYTLRIYKDEAPKHFPETRPHYE